MFVSNELKVELTVKLHQKQNPECQNTENQNPELLESRNSKFRMTKSRKARSECLIKEFCKKKKIYCMKT